ncbi:MAG TPA: nuclear transport factor 2 family protein [Jiangellaceae bacterium]|nr:nuclear transport factor 2 family protein [Jiangellaceae bacterium]
MTETTGDDQRARRFVAEFAKGWEQPDFDEFIAHFRRWFAADVRLSQPLAPDGVGHRALNEQFRRLFVLIPDLSGIVRRWAAHADEVFIELELTGTLGRKPITWTACDRLVLRGGIAVERRSYFDPTPLVLATLRRPTAWPRLLRSALPGTRPHPAGTG